MPILASEEVEARESREVIHPALGRSVHGDVDIEFMFQEGDSIPGKKGLVPPFEVGPAGLINEDWDVDGGSETFVGEDPVSEEPA